jgi:hypothetical protein
MTAMAVIVAFIGPPGIRCPDRSLFKEIKSRAVGAETLESGFFREVGSEGW